jgi:ketosteroid isomerase-like protein
MTIRETFEALVDSVTVDRDAAAFAELWVAGDPTITMWGSDLDEVAEGPDAVRRLGEAIAASEHDLRFRWEEIATHERGEAAWVNARGHILAGGAEHPYRVTAVFLRGFSGWRCHTFCGSIPD